MYPIPSVDGKRLFVMGGQGRGEVMRYDSNAKQFVPFLGGISAREVDVSRDGQWVTYTKDSAVWRSKMDGSERLQLTFAPISGYEPRWSPDGKQIVFTDYPSKIFVVSADGGAPRQLMPEDQPLVAGAATWSPDANSIVFVRSTRIAKSFAIYRLDLKTQQVSQLPGSEGMYSARLSPNGRYVSAFAADGEKLMLYDFRTQTWSELAQGKFSYNNWSRDSNSVYVAQMLGEQRVERVELDRVNIADRKLEHVLSLKDPTTWGSWVSLASDDLPILTRNESTQEIYALDLQLP
jgi:Tol biopolymer transport system component